MSGLSRKLPLRIAIAGTLGLASWALFSDPAAATPVATTFNYTGAMQYFTVPSGICQVTVVAQGGQGASGGNGAIITATVPVPEDDRLSILAGGAGVGSVGGYGGGGGGTAGGGGGASVVATSANTVLVVAGGGGGNGTVAGYNVGRGPGGGSGSTSGTGLVGGGGGGMTANSGGLGSDSSGDTPGSVLSAGNGGMGDGTYGGGGGAIPWTYNSAAPDGSNGGYVGSLGGGSADTGGIGSGRGGLGGNTGGRAAGGSGGIGFAGGGAGGGGGGGGGWGGGGGSGTHGDGGNSYVTGSATSTYSTGTGDGSVTITYDPATDQCAGTPAAPSGLAVTTGIGSASVAFTAPNAGAPITSYTVHATDSDDPARGAQVATGSSSPVQVTGLHAGDHYTFTVIATNANGDGLESAPSAAVVTGSQPSAPRGVTAAAPSTVGTAAVSFAPPADNGGSAITGYTVTAIDTTNALRGGQQRTGSASPLAVTGLAGGDHYVFVVRAINGLGTSDPSASSNAVVAHSPAPGLRITSASHTRFRVGSFGRFRFTSAGGTHTRYVEFGALPRGISFSSAGLLSGKPAARTQGIHRLTIVVVSGTRTATQSFTLVVAK